MSETIKTLTFTLDEPVEVSDEIYTELTFERRKTKHLLALDGVVGDMRRTFALYAAMASVPIAVIEELDPDDFDRLVEELVPLMGKSASRAMEEQLRQAREGEATPSA